MKLITEYLAGTTEAIYEESEAGKKLYIEGVFMQANKVNRNGRIYPTPILEGAVNKYIEEEVKTGGAIGELNHPNYPIPNPKFASHKIVKLEKEGDDFLGKALILNTPEGNIVRGLIEGEVRLGVSSRGLGSTKSLRTGVNEIQNGYLLKTVDIVHNPSAPDAFVNGILEGVEYLVDGSTIKQSTVEQIEDEIKKCPKSQLQAKKVEIFERAMKEMSEPKFKDPRLKNLSLQQVKFLTKQFNLKLFHLMDFTPNEVNGLFVTDYNDFQGHDLVMMKQIYKAITGKTLNYRVK